MRTSIVALLLSAAVSFCSANEVSYNASTKHYEISPESANSLAARQARVAADAAVAANNALNRSNRIASINAGLSVFGLASISSASEITHAWKTNVCAVVNNAYTNAVPAQKDDVLFNGMTLYKSILLLLIAP